MNKISLVFFFGKKVKCSHRFKRIADDGKNDQRGEQHHLAVDRLWGWGGATMWMSEVMSVCLTRRAYVRWCNEHEQSVTT